MFFFKDTATTEIYTLSLHDALPIYYGDWAPADTPEGKRDRARAAVHEDTFKRALKARLKIVFGTDMGGIPRSEEHTSELQSLRHLVCRLLLEKKKNNTHKTRSNNKE